MSDDCKDVNMASVTMETTPMSLDVEDDAPPDGHDNESDEYSGDEDYDEDLLGKPSDDVDGCGFSKLYYRLIGKNIDRQRPNIKSKPLTHPDSDNDIYNFSHHKRGLAVIINNEKFPGDSQLSPRKGTKYDSKDLKNMFQHMGFTVKTYNNLSGPQMILKLKKIAANLKYDHTKADCFACSILSHGDAVEMKPTKPPYDVMERQDVVFGVDGQMVPTKYIFNLFNDRCCPELEGKPRLFFIQACRGWEMDDGISIKVWKDNTKKSRNSKRPHGADAKDAVLRKLSPPERRTASSVPVPDRPTASDEPVTGTEPKGHPAAAVNTAESGSCEDMSLDLEYDEILQDETDAGTGSSGITVSPSPIFKDFLVMYCSPPGYFSWRRNNGAWFIQSLNHVMLHSNLSTTSLNKLLTRVSQRVANKYESIGNCQLGKKQVPCLMSMLTKDVYFKPKK